MDYFLLCVVDLSIVDFWFVLTVRLQQSMYKQECFKFLVS